MAIKKKILVEELNTILTKFSQQLIGYYLMKIRIRAKLADFMGLMKLILDIRVAMILIAFALIKL
jgi:hypothetical protein